MTRQKLNVNRLTSLNSSLGFHSLTYYRPGKENTFADARSRPEEMPGTRRRLYSSAATS
jgi:hypothetical protein